MATAYILNPDGTQSTETIIVEDYTNDPLLPGDGGGYYIKKHYRVPVFVSGTKKWLAVFPKTLSSQVIETTDKVFITDTQKTDLASLLAKVVNDAYVDGTTKKVAKINFSYNFNELFWDSSSDELRYQYTRENVLYEKSIANAEFVNDALALKSPLASPTFTGTPKAPTATASTNTTQIATTAFVKTAIANLVAGAPEALDTLNEIATALQGNQGSITDIFTELGKKANLTGASFTGDVGVQGTLAAMNMQIDEGSLKFRPLQYSMTFGLGSTTLTANRDITLPNDNGVVALTKNIPYVPYIGFTAPTSPKAGDLWFS